MRVLLVTNGSHGDVNPFIAVARALSARGHDATIATNPYYRGQVEDEGVGFEPVGEVLDLTRVGELYPDIMHPRRGSRVVIETLLAGFARDCYPRVRGLLAGGRFDVVVHHHIAMAAEWAARGAGVPTVTAVLAPMLWASRGDVISPTASWPVRPGRVLRWVFHAALPPAAGWLIDRPMNRVRRELGLAKDRGGYMRITRGGDVNLGLWSSALRGPCTGDPASGVVCGFPWHDRQRGAEGAEDRLERFLADGEPPVLFSLGTAAVHVAGDFYERAAGALRLLGRRGVLLVGPGRPVPRGLPAGSIAVEYAPFSSVMRRCAVNVHHGGIGSTGQGLRAGRPTVVVPHAHDQFDNAARLVRLGVSATVPRPKVTERRLADALSRMLSGDAAAKAAELGRAVAAEDGAARAAEVIERVVGKGG